MGNKKYFWWTLVLALIVSPIIVSITSIPGLIVGPGWLVLSPIVLFMFWAWRFRKKVLPSTLFEQILPIVIPLMLSLGIWIVLNFLGKYDYASGYQDYAFLATGLFTFPNFIMSFEGEYAFLPYMFMATYAVILLALVRHNYRHHRRPKWTRAGGVLTALVIVLCLLPIYQSYQHARYFVDGNVGSTKQVVSDEINFADYAPFTNSKKLTPMTTPSALTFNQDYPRLDGATAAYPVYASLTQALYQGLDKDTVKQYVQCSQTIEAYKRLIAGEVDMIFVAQPSTAQLADAKKQGVTLKLTPIAKEAFVFFTNRDNKVNSLTVNQIQQIYQKKVTNWHKVGGSRQAIIPYQRPADSGSQTTMEKKVMQGKKLTRPLRAEMAEGMGGILSDVASYQNKKGAIGYSFRYYATGMNANDQIKLLAINGVEPTVNNIQSERYPFTVSVYAVTNEHPTPNTQKLLQTLQGSWGQELVQKVGYVPLHK